MKRNNVGLRLDITLSCTVEPRYKEVGYNKTLL